MHIQVTEVLTLIFFLWNCDVVLGHGRMIEPAARNVMWRYKYNNPRNYNDMGLNCGGFTNQFERQGGRCGVCGDPYQGPRDNEAGGKYARGVVARQYHVGAFINVTVELTSNHMGYFEFRLCPVNDPHKKATQACLDRHLLNIVGHGTRYFIAQQGANVFEELAVMLPPNLQCSQCVLQWKWVAGQSMGPDGYGGECLGCGNQENFINCADIAIGNQVVSPLPPLANGAVASAPEPAGPPYDTYSAGNGVNAGSEPDIAAVKAIVNKLLRRANSLQPQTQSSWNSATNNNNGHTGHNAPVVHPNPVPQWKSAVPAWKATTVAPVSAWQHSGGFDWFVGSDSVGHHAAPSSVDNNYEPGEYPEQGEIPSHGSSSLGSSSYIQGYNDAMRRLKEQFGLNNGLAEVSMHIQEHHKHGAPSTGGNGHPPTCPDGSEPDCMAANTAQSSLFDSFCSNACQLGQCAKELCKCTCSGSEYITSHAGNFGTCRAVDLNKAGSMNTWCVQNCQRGNCPENLCTCV